MMLSPQVKASLLTAIFTVILWYGLNAFIYQSWNLAQNNASRSQPFTAQGTGTATAAPDQAQVLFSIAKTAPKLQDAQNQANTSTNTIVADIEKLGIAKKDIQTSNYNSSPNYENSTSGTMMIYPPQQNNQTIISYTVEENITLTITDNTKVNSAIDTITNDGAENISGPNYTFSDAMQQSLQNKARIMAIADAKQKAQTIANAAGIHLGRVTSVQENSGGYPIPMQPIMMNSKAVAVGSAPTQINQGQNTVTDNVTLYYETW